MTAVIAAGIDWAPRIAGLYLLVVAALVVVHRLQQPGKPRHAGTKHREQP